MRILIGNDGFGDAGGVQSYLDAVLPALRARGHELALVHRDPVRGAFRVAGSDLPQVSVAEQGIDGAIDRARAWKPDVVFSHNMNTLDVDRRLAAVVPVVKFMHGYFGTCIGGLKHHAFPAPRPCDRVFGPACLALYLPRYCGQMSVVKLVDHYRWATDQHALFSAYRAIIVASEHMKREYVRNGADGERVHANPLFPTHSSGPAAAPARAPSIAPGPAPSTGPDSPKADAPTVVFMSRMTPLKGGDVLIRAVAQASRRLPRAIDLVMAGDGPVRASWEQLASALGARATFPGWISGDDRWALLRRADLVAVPSTWPEPFGLVGLEASALGVPAIAFDVGGEREWLRPGRNGVLVPGDPPTPEAFADALVAAFSRPDDLAAMRRTAPGVAREMSLDRHVDRLERILGSDAHPAHR